MTGNVRVTLPHGAQYTGRLISLTATEVVVRQKKSVRDTPYLLTDIKIVETMHHNTRNLAIAGGAAGLGISLASDLCGTGRLCQDPGRRGGRAAADNGHSVNSSTALIGTISRAEGVGEDLVDRRLLRVHDEVHVPTNRLQRHELLDRAHRFRIESAVRYS